MNAGLVKGRKFVLTLICAIASLGAVAQVKSWEFSQVDSLLNHNPKPILILLSTDWCQYCHMQQHQLHKNKDFQQKDNPFYFVNFNAESKAPIHFKGQDYVYKPTGARVGIHELAIALNGPNKLTFPTWIVLNEKNQILFRHQGILLPKEIQKLLETFEIHKEL